MEFLYDLKIYELSIQELKKFYGIEDCNLKLIEKYMHCQIHAHSETIRCILLKKNQNEIQKIFERMVKKIRQKSELSLQEMQEIIMAVLNQEEEMDEQVKFVTTFQGKVIRPKNKAQYHYYQLLEKNTIVFAMGAAGTGKTYLAVAYGVNLLKNKKINKIIITRPIVEAGENLGFLPGELKEKVDPYLTPIYDAFHDLLGAETTMKYLEKQIIEIAPLAYMRGRTLSDAYVILDEAQNTTSTQMKMFLTRLGFNAKMVITGDESQIDLKSSISSGIVVAKEILQSLDDIAFIEFDGKDVVRNPLVSQIIQAYSKKEKSS